MKEEANLNIEEMARAGLQIGHSVSKLHPRMREYIAGIRNNIYLFDLEKTKEKLEKVLSLIARLTEEDKKIMLVGTKVQMRDLVKTVAQECQLPYVTERWLGGTFTNFETIRKRINYFKELKRKKEAGELNNYTKKEQARFAKELENLRVKFEGIQDLDTLPPAVFICSLDKDINCAREARKKGITVIAICDTNIDPRWADYPIPASDDIIRAVQYILEKIKKIVIEKKPKIEQQ